MALTSFKAIDSGCGCSSPQTLPEQKTEIGRVHCQLLAGIRVGQCVSGGGRVLEEAGFNSRVLVGGSIIHLAFRVHWRSMASLTVLRWASVSDTSVLSVTGIKSSWMIHCFVKSSRCMSVCTSTVLLLGSMCGCTMPLAWCAERPIVTVLESSWIVSCSGDRSRSKVFSRGLALSRTFTRSSVDAPISSSTLGILISLLSFSHVALATS